MEEQSNLAKIKDRAQTKKNKCLQLYVRMQADISQNLSPFPNGKEIHFICLNRNSPPNLFAFALDRPTFFLKNSFSIAVETDK